MVNNVNYPVFFLQLQSICLTLGMPEQSLLDAGHTTCRTESRSLEEVFDFLHDDADVTGDTWRVFMDLLGRMLHLDQEERITPDQVLNHPFITMSQFNTP